MHSPAGRRKGEGAVMNWLDKEQNPLPEWGRGQGEGVARVRAPKGQIAAVPNSSCCSPTRSHPHPNPSPLKGEGLAAPRPSFPRRRVSSGSISRANTFKWRSTSDRRAKLFCIFVWVALSAMWVTPTNAASEQFTSLLLLQSCQKGEATSDRWICLAYVRGFAEGVGSYRNLINAPAHSYACVPESVQPDQLRLVFVKWALENPEKLHWPARNGVFTALLKNFHCPK